MKKIIIISFILFHFVACDKENIKPELEYPDNIIAGKTEDIGVKYSGIIKDTLFFNYPSSSANRFIDINDDGVNDFELKFSGSASPGHSNSNNSILSLGNSFIAAPVSESNIVDTISFNDTIDNKLNWVNDNCVLYNYYWDAAGASSKTGLWNDVRGKYIGTKILVENKELYGWIRIEITYGWNLTLIDYACTGGY